MGLSANSFVPEVAIMVLWWLCMNTVYGAAFVAVSDAIGVMCSSLKLYRVYSVLFMFWLGMMKKSSLLWSVNAWVCGVSVVFG